MNDVEIKIFKKDCKHIVELSRYNNNVYLLPFIIENCNYLNELYDSLTEEFAGNTIGIVEDMKYIPKFWLHAFDDDQYFIINTLSIKERNEWT